MPTRLLKDWTCSEKINQLSFEAEMLFARLIMKADDYGSFHANPKLIKAATFPLRDILPETIELWLKELIANQIVVQYEVAGRDYIRIVDFGQRLRNKRNAFPQPPEEILIQLAALCSNSLPDIEEKRSRRELEEEVEGELPNVPSEDEFLQYCQTIKSINFDSLKFALQAKYHAWVENGWKDGYNKKIKNWKTKVLNTIPHLKPNYGNGRNDKSRFENSISSLDEQLRSGSSGNR